MGAMGSVKQRRQWISTDGRDPVVSGPAWLLTSGAEQDGGGGHLEGRQEVALPGEPPRGPPRRPGNFASNACGLVCVGKGCVL